MQLRVRLDDRFMERLQVEGGPTSRAIVQRASDAETPALDFSPPRLTARVQLDSLLKVGDVVLRQGGERFVLGEHSRTPWYRTFWLFTASRQVTWRRPATAVDTLTDVVKTTGWGTPTQIWVGWETMTREALDRDMRLREEMYRVVTGADVRENDQIDGQQVKRINRVLGISVLTVQ